MKPKEHSSYFCDSHKRTEHFWIFFFLKGRSILPCCSTHVTETKTAIRSERAIAVSQEFNTSVKSSWVLMFSQCLQSTVLKRETDRCLCSTQPARLPFILPNTPPPFHQRLHSYTTMTVPLISVFLPPDWFKACMMWGGLKERYGTGSDVINSPWISQCHRNRKPFFFFSQGSPRAVIIRGDSI